MTLLPQVLFLLSCLTLWVNSTHEYKIIIVGAGPSGIATASKLLENGIEDILILEAEPRIGGRVKTVDFDGKTIDLGGEWVDGEKNNIVFEILKEKRLLHLLEREAMPETFYISSRQNISDEFSKDLYASIVGIYFGSPTSESLGHVIPERFHRIISAKFENDPEKLKVANWSLSFLRHFVEWIETSFNWNNNAKSSDFEICGGAHDWAWKNSGYHKFLDVLTKKYPDPTKQLPIDEKTILNKEVTRISNNVDDENIKISCADGSTYKAKHVVFTASLGVLKENAKTLFTPELPKSKINAIERIGYGAIMKVLLKYDRKWWGSNPGFNFIWTDSDRLSSKEEFPAGPTNLQGESWIVEMFNVLALPDSNILLVWFSGNVVPDMEKLDEKTLIEGIDFVFNKFLGHMYHIPKPQKMMRTNWHSNPHFRGVNSFNTVNSSGEDVRNLLAPIRNENGDPILLFAGEATNPKHYGGVHGAVESGFREANRLIQLFEKS